MNQMTLGLVAKSRGYELPRWAGEGQWKKLGGKLKPGGRKMGVSILVPREGRTFTDINGKEVVEGRYYEVQTVYNVAEVAGLPKKFYEPIDADINQETRLEDLENVIKEIGPDFVESFGEDAFYRPSTDKIHMPAFEQFVDATAFYGTAMHETVHWTSHPTRLNRTLGKEFGDEQYAFEELIAEIGSAFALGAMGIEPTIRDNHLVYVAGWLKKLTADPLALHRAILSAQQANDFLLDRSSTMRRLAGIPDDERKGKDNAWLEVPMLAGYEDSPRIKPTTGVSGTMEDMLDVEFPQDFAPEARRTSTAEREMSSLSRNLPTKTKDGIVITPSGRLSSGRGPIKGKNPNAPEIKPIDETVALRLAFGLSNEPTEEQRDIMAVAMNLIRNKDPRILSILAGAGTGKTTTLKSIAWGLQREFDLWPEGDLRRPEQLRYLSDRYGVDFSGMSAEQVKESVEKLAEEKSINNLYYAVFNKKNQFEAELEFPRNTGVSTTDKIWYWSLKLGQGDKKYGTGMRRKMQFALISPTDRKVNNPGAKNPKFISEALTPDEPERLLPQQVRELFDGTTESFDGIEPGYRSLGWTRLDTGSDWKEFLDFADEKRWKGQETRPTSVPILDDKGKPVRDAKGKIQTTMEDSSGFILPDAGSTFVSRDQFGDLFKNALTRWSLSKEEKASAWMFTQPAILTQELDTPRGSGKDISPVDTILDEKDIPAQWVEALQEAIDKFSDGDSSMLPPRDSVAKLWMLTEPDLRSDPGLITHTESQERKKTIPDSYAVGDTYELEGETWIVKTRKKSKGKNVQVTLTKRMATEEKPLSAFFVDEAQDSNEILETVLDNNRANLPIVVVGDDRQAVYAFRNAKNILESLNADYELTITESFRYGEVIGHLTNLALGMQNLYLDKQGVPQLPWKHVKGKAQVVVNRLFDPLLPKKDRKGLEPVDEIDDMTREFLLKDLEEKFSTPEKRLNFSVHTVGKKAGEKLTRKEQDDKLRELRDSILEPKAGKIVDRVEEANKEVPNLPTMILCRTNAEIINETLKFIKLVVDSPNAKKDDNGLPILPEVVIPLSKHEELLKFTRHLEYIFMPQAEKSKRGLPEVSGWIGPIFDQGGLKRVINQASGQQARSAYKLIMQAPPGGGVPLGISGMLTLLQGRQKIEIDAKTGKEKITVIPASILPERKSVTLENFRIEPEEIDSISKFSKAASAPQAKESQLQRIVIIPPPSTSTDGRGAVYAQLEIIGGDEKKPGKPSGRIIVTGDGVDTGRPQTLPDGSEARNIPPNQRVGNGRYRRDLEKVILNLGLSDKVKIMQDAERGGPRAGGKRRAFDGFVIEGENLEESTKILNDIGQAMRDSAQGPGGDVEITTIQLSKGRESDFVAVAEDLGDPSDSLAANIPQGQAGLAFMEETNLIHVAFSRAKKMIDPGWKGFKYYLHDESTKDVRAAIKKAVQDGHIPPELDKGAFGDEGGIPLPKFYAALNKMSPDDIDENNLPDRAALDEKEIEIDPDLVFDVDKDINDVVRDPSDYESEVDIDDLIDADEMGDDSDGQMRLSSGTSNFPGPGRRLSRRMGVRSSSRVTPGAISAQDLAGIRLFGDPNSPNNRRKTDYAMQTWAGFRERGIEINAEGREQTKNAMKKVGEAMKARQNRVRVGRVGDNLRNDNPSAETWMLSVDALAEQLRIPEDFNGQGESLRSRSATRQEIASLLGLSEMDKQKIQNSDAGVNHDAVRLLVAELGNQPELAGWRYFAPVSRDEIRKIIPSPTGDTESITPQVDMAMENAGRANMRDRFIIETFGKDAFPHWFDQDEEEAISPAEYSQLGEVDERAKFRATGRFAPDDPFEGDSEAEIDLYGQSFDELENPPSLSADDEIIKLDKTDKKDFEIEPLLKYLGIDKKEWRTRLSEILSEKFGTDSTGVNPEWEKQGIPTATIAHMIRKGVLPNAADVWKDGKAGKLFDEEMERPKYAVYEALNEFIDRSFPNSRLNSKENRNKIVGATDMGTALRDAAAAKGSAWSAKKGNEPRFAVSEMQTMVDRFNEIFGTDHTLEDIFSAEQLRNAKTRIENGETLSGKKRKPKQAD
jgi:antirestriction protein ArdC